MVWLPKIYAISAELSQHKLQEKKGKNTTKKEHEIILRFILAAIVVGRKYHNTVGIDHNVYLQP